MSFHPFYRRDIKVNEASLNKEDLKRLFSIIQTQLDKAVDIQIANTNPDLFNDFEAAKEEIRRVFVLYYSATKRWGTQLVATTLLISTLAHSPSGSRHYSYPRRVHSRYMLDLRAGIGWNFLLILREVEFQSTSSRCRRNPTENGTAVNIFGLEEPWVIETYDKLREFFDARSNNRIYIHRSGIYDAFLFTIIIPLFLYALYRFEVENPAFIDSVPKITIIAIYVYSFAFVGLVGRLLFQYARWLFPLVEYTSDRRWSPKAQRAFLATIMVGIIGAAVYDAIKFFL